MKPFSTPPMPPFDAASVTGTIERAFAAAGLDTSAGPMREVAETLRRALASRGAAAQVPKAGTASPFVDVPARVIDPGPVPAAVAPQAPGTFVTRAYGNAAGSRSYKLYVPARAASAPMPIVVMLHGCTQSADDFAAGTRMNHLAEVHGFLVVYPEQAQGANPSKCWNWFQAQHQVRDAGEPSLIAGIVHEVAARHGADPQRVFVAGLSAGAAMAVVLGETYPDLFAAVGAHSGLPYGSAHDVPSAMSAMKGGRGLAARAQPLAAAAPAPRRQARQAVPSIVFHGDRDHTVQHANGVEIAQQAGEAHAARAGAALHPEVEQGTAPGARRYSRTVHRDALGQVNLESWTVHGAGHAWSGGDPAGSYTDPMGPDASAEMVRFFLALPRGGTA